MTIQLHALGYMDSFAIPDAKSVIALIFNKKSDNIKLTNFT